MDIAELLDSTEPVEVSLAGKTVVCEVYTAGFAVRATLDQLAIIGPIETRAAKLYDRIQEIEAELEHEVPEDRKLGLEEELETLQSKHFKEAAHLSAKVVPLVVKSAEIDGEPFMYNGRAFSECAADLPAAFLMEIQTKANKVMANPTTPDLSESGSGLEGAPEIDQAESMLA